MDDLSKLGIKYGTDKIGKHHYLPVYYELFKDRRETVKKLLEIGPAEGAGLFMFRDFFPNATIYGAEIDQKRVDKLQGLDRIEVFKCDQASDAELMQLTWKTNINIDIVIDDGSHKPEDQLSTCRTLMKLLKKGVIYIIEDVAYPNQVAKPLAQLGYDVSIHKVGTRYDDCLIVVRKPNG